MAVLPKAPPARAKRQKRPKRLKPPGRRRHLIRRLRPMLRPRSGHRLPRELRARNVGRLAAGIEGGLLGPAFEGLLQRIEQSPIYPGNRIAVYLDGDQAFSAIEEAVAAAEREVLLESYIFKDDLIGCRLFGALAAAAHRGVAVRVLADGLGSASTRTAFWQAMVEQGIEAHLFHPAFGRLWYQPFRDHRKILVVDRRIAFTGGMNIGQEYGSPSGARGAWRDSHLRVTGPAAWEMATVFCEGWERAGGRPFELSPMVLKAAGEEGARVLVLDARPMRGSAEAISTLTAIAAAARARLWITNAYFAPGHGAVRVLSRAARRGVDVRLLLPARTDVPIVRHAGHGFFAALLRHGVRIFEYEAAVLHAKSLVADGYVSVLGSTNFDFRSFLFNAECNLVMLDREVAGTLERAFDNDLRSATEVTVAAWRGRTLGHRALDRACRVLSPVL
jgi:cardiolipin synthase